MLASLKIQTSTALGFGDLRTRDAPDRNRVPRHLASPIDFSVGTEPKPVNFKFFTVFRLSEPVALERRRDQSLRLIYWSQHVVERACGSWLHDDWLH